MKEFSHISDPLRLHQGEQALSRLARELDRAGVSRAVLVTGASLGRNTAVLQRVRDTLGDRVVAVWSGVQAHSPLTAVLDAAAMLAAHKADGVVALGGGSAIVTARAATIAHAEGGDLRRLATHRATDGRLHSPKLLAPKLPQFVVPTTPTTAMVKAGTAVLDPDSKARLALFDPKTRAVAVALDPLVLGSAPRDLVWDAAFNTLTLAVEGVLSPTVDPFAEALLLQAIRLISDALADGEPDAQVVPLAVAAALAGRGTDHAGAGVATVLAHALGARCDLGHGALNAIFLPEAVRFNADAAPGAILQVARAFDSASVDALIARLETLRAQSGFAARLRDLAVPQAILPDVANQALGDWFLLGNPRKIDTAAPLEALLSAVW